MGRKNKRGIYYDNDCCFCCICYRKSSFLISSIVALVLSVLFTGTCIILEFTHIENGSGFKALSDYSDNSFALAQLTLAMGVLFLWGGVVSISLLGCSGRQHEHSRMTTVKNVFYVSTSVSALLMTTLWLIDEFVYDDYENWHGLWSTDGGDKFLIVILTDISASMVVFFSGCVFLFWWTVWDPLAYSRQKHKKSRRRRSKQPKEEEHMHFVESGDENDSGDFSGPADQDGYSSGREEEQEEEYEEEEE